MEQGEAWSRSMKPKEAWSEQKIGASRSIEQAVA
jgi:hypothetical protein